MHAVLHLFSDCLQLSSKALGLRLALDHERVLPGFGAVVREAQEVEGLRASLPSGGSCVGGEPPELDQPGLALMERQAELQQPVFEIHEELLPICLELTAEHHIICVPTDDHRSGCPPSSPDRKSTRLNSSHGYISYAVFCLKKKKNHRSGLLINIKNKLPY